MRDCFLLSRDEENENGEMKKSGCCEESLLLSE
jgi:hypothetical protein